MRAGRSSPPNSARRTNDLQTRICETFANLLGLDRVGILDNFFELGGNSLLMRTIAALRITGRLISTTTFFQNPTLSHRRRAERRSCKRTRRPRTRTNNGGRDGACRDRRHGRPLPAPTTSTRCGTTSAPVASRSRSSAMSWIRRSRRPLRGDSSYVKARGVLNDVPMFDAAFSASARREAELRDPQQRKFLEITGGRRYAGLHARRNTRDISASSAACTTRRTSRSTSASSDLIEKVGEFTVMLANEKDYISTRVAHRLNLTGPAISVHTACSTSLVAVSQAFDSCVMATCDMAIAGGVAITCPPNSGYLYQEGAMLSPDGHTRSFDADAQGTAFSDGAAVVLLKRLSDAIADGDTIYGVIRGTHVNNDGSRKASFTAPSADAQVAGGRDRAGSCGRRPATHLLYRGSRHGYVRWAIRSSWKR